MTAVDAGAADGVRNHHRAGRRFEDQVRVGHPDLLFRCVARVFELVKRSVDAKSKR